MTSRANADALKTADAPRLDRAQPGEEVSMIRRHPSAPVCLKPLTIPASRTTPTLHPHQPCPTRPPTRRDRRQFCGLSGRPVPSNDADEVS